MQDWVYKPAVYWKFPKIFQIPLKNLVRSSIVIALQPVDCKPVTLVKRETSRENKREFLQELLCGTNNNTNVNTNTNANTKSLLLLY